MLFDLRGRGRRRVVKVIYLGLAILLGGGLVLFGIGGDVQGGLFDAFRENDGNATKQVREDRDRAADRTKANPNDARAWALLADAELTYAAQSEGYNQETGEVGGDARRRLEAAKRAWERHLQLAGERPNGDVAARMKNALAQLGDNEGAVRAQEIYIDSIRDPGYGDYAQLAGLAYNAGQTRKGDLAADRAVELAPKDQKETVEQQLESLKGQGAAGAAGAGATTAPAPAPAPTTTGG